MVDLRYSESNITAEAFVGLAQRVWPRDYDLTRIDEALRGTFNIGAWEGDLLVGTVRVLTDGYLFATIPEIIVHPDYQRRGIGRRLMHLALGHAPRGKLFFGAQDSALGFFERIGCERGPTGFVADRHTLR
jgi:ribosomal protein S18 acetylase RimI-like enzyme